MNFSRDAGFMARLQGARDGGAETVGVPDIDDNHLSESHGIHSSGGFNGHRRMGTVETHSRWTGIHQRS